MNDVNLNFPDLKGLCVMNDANLNFPDLKGKYVSITIMNDSFKYGLFDPHFEMQGNRIFIVGTIPEGATESNWGVGCRGSVAWSRVTDYVVFENLEAYSKMFKGEKYSWPFSLRFTF